MKKVPQFIAGEFVQSQTQNWIDVTNPATNEALNLASNLHNKALNLQGLCGYNAPPAPTSSSSTTNKFSKRARAPNSAKAKSPNEPARGFAQYFR